ncbi:hypothetical protein EV193_108197 [Herbihabitans rhizosphaerae]|uniref:AsnC-like helix-turn-helix protein n=1 Tax=Herbihabitans rhizosphaerae TaxID=1872711 RepID=A0A4V2ES21_9PSEU|nr:hypothetical protein EV193_108197 [Herbihabitans rhizosphaerae]
MDARLLATVAEVGRAAVHEIAAKLGMDPRDVASRLVALSGTGLPLLVGVECDPNGIRNALRAPTPYSSGASGPHSVHGTPSGVYQPNPPSGPYQVHGTPSGVYPPSGAYPGPPSGPYRAPGPHQGQPQGPPPQQQHPSPPSGPFPAQSGRYPGVPQSQPHSGAFTVGPPSAPTQVQQPPAPPPPNEPVRTWGPPQTAAWARSDEQTTETGSNSTQPTVRTNRPQDTGPREGNIGTVLETLGLEGERLSIKLIEVVDPADYLFTAAGYKLAEGERSVVVHTEVMNRGNVPYSSLPDQYLVLVTPEGEPVAKAPVSLSSRPAHRIGVAPGETAGGHTVYVLPETTEITSVRWSARPDDENRTLTWVVEE